MADHVEHPDEHRAAAPPWRRRTLLSGTGLALTGALAACAGTGGKDGGDEENPESGTNTADKASRVKAPDIIGTADWEAVEPEQYLQTLHERPSYLVIHHTTTPNVTDGSREAAIEIAQRVQNGHINQHWGDSGQHFTVSRGGFALEARHGSKFALEKGDRFILGVHALGFNAYALGIECEGTYMVNPPPQKMYEGLLHLCTYICQQYDLPPSRIIGHRDLVRTSCCGDAFYAKLPVLREDVKVSLERGELRVTEGFGADNLFDDSDVKVEERQAPAA
ncbi:peptidoglycan recognition family protein [uncultured Micrococcus sp.]|uniref:peptidoglycan recognition protein family protein n=1 Tax=uncultured Micrococcus sp. TaxID=114051 RepID=UPI0025914E11|nr:peptidoglycan recognition family protein [uncultured Micrococcus sp.]